MISQALVWAGGSISYSAIFTVLGVACALLTAFSLSLFRGRDTVALTVLAPCAILFSLILARFMHWYSHPLQYTGFFAAMTDYSVGGFSLSGAFLGTALAALLVSNASLTEDMPRLLDTLSPGMALGIGIGRLGCLYSSADRGHIIVYDHALQKLPFAVETAGTWRFATFFIQSMWALIVGVFLLFFYLQKNRRSLVRGMPRNGYTAMLFIAFYSAGQLVLDSTRYDGDFLRSNGFIHMVQVLCFLVLVGITVYLTVLYCRRYGNSIRVFVCWAVFVLGSTLAGFMEYLVQRQGARYILAYSLMTVGFGLALGVFLCFFQWVRRPPRRRRLPVTAQEASDEEI